MVVGILILWPVIIIILYNLVVYLLEQLKVGSIEEKAVFITGCDSGFGYQLVFKCIENDLTVFAGCLTQAVSVINLIQVHLGMVCIPTHLSPLGQR